MTDGPLYVYGVLSIDERDAVAVAGVEGSVVRTVDYDGLSALASPLRGEQLRAAREVRAHLRVLQEAAEAATVLPVRFGTVLESERAVRERLLEPNAEYLDALLKRLSGCVQLTVRGAYDQEALLREVLAVSPPLKELAARVREISEAAGYYDRIRLGEAIAGEVGAHRERDTRLALDTLGPAAVASNSEDPSDSYEAFNLSFLVRRAEQEEFTRRVNDLAEAVSGRVELRYVGPLPPYSFTEGELEAA